MNINITIKQTKQPKQIKRPVGRPPLASGKRCHAISGVVTDTQWHRWEAFKKITGTKNDGECLRLLLSEIL